MASRFTYRLIDDPSDLRPGERLVQLNVPTHVHAFQGDRRLTPTHLIRYFAERETPFRSRIRRGDAR